MAESLKDQATRGVIWSAIERFSVQGIMFVLTIIIARVVTPSEYGLIAMLNIFVAVAQTFVDSGFSNALVQKKDRDEDDFSTVFYFNIVISVVAYLLLYFASPYIAEFYNEPRLDLVTKYVGMNLIIRGLTVVQRAKLTIKLDFKTQAKASLLGVVIGGAVGTVMAYRGYGVWSLVSQTLCSSGFSTLFLWIFARWHPRLVFSMESFRSLFSFGSKLLLSGLLNTIYENLYSLVIGRYYSAVDVGYYNQANRFALFPSDNITSIITRAVYPLQCSMQDDEERLSSTFSQYLRLCCFIVFPLMVGLAAVSKPLILLLLTEKWISAATPLSILALGYMLMPLRAINCQILNVKGRSDYYLKAELIKKISAFSLLFIALPYGLNMLCWSVVAYNILDVIIVIYYTKQVVQTSYISQIRDLFSIFTITMIMGFVAYFLPSLLSDKAIIQVLIGISSGFVTYIGISYFLRIKELDILYVISNKNIIRR